MPDILTLILPIMVLIGMGAVYVRCGLFDASALPVLVRFVMVACVPVMLISAVSGGGQARGVQGASAYAQAAAYGAASLVVVATLALILRGMGERLDRAVILGLGGASSNTLFLGFPVASAVIPDQAGPRLPGSSWPRWRSSFRPSPPPPSGRSIAAAVCRSRMF